MPKMMELRPSGFLRMQYLVIEGSEILTELHMALFDGRSLFKLGGKVYRLETRGWLLQRFFLISMDQTMAQGKSYWNNQIEIKFPSGLLTARVRRVGLLRQTFELLDGKQLYGTIRNEGWMRCRIYVDLPNGMSLPEKIFIAWIFMIYANGPGKRITLPVGRRRPMTDEGTVIP